MYTQAVKDEKDSSKNLVSGEFEREYRDGMVARPPCRRSKACVATLVAALAIIFIWLLGLTVIREVQLNTVRTEIEQLTANMIAMETTVKILTEKLDGKVESHQFNNHLEQFKQLEDTIFADLDHDGSIVIDDPPPKNRLAFEGDEDVERLGGLTVFEDDEEGTDDENDDEDLYDIDDDDDEDPDNHSGDYGNYDSRRDKVGKTNMVKLKPEDFHGSIVTLGKNRNASVIRKIKQMLNENPELPDSELAAVTPPAPPAPPAQAALDRRRRSVFADSPLDSVDEYAAPRAYAKPDVRRLPKKFSSPNPEQKSFANRMEHVSRIARNSEDEVTAQRKPFVAAHFHGNTSHLNTDIHQHYKGNGLVKLPHGHDHNVWYPSPWTMASPHRPTLTEKGHVHVHHTGVYLVYAQIYYLDAHDVISWVLRRKNEYESDWESLLQCAQSAHSPDPRDKPNSCFSASALFLRKGDRLAVRNTGGDRHSVMQPEKSFIGLIQLADTSEPEREL